MTAPTDKLNDKFLESFDKVQEDFKEGKNLFEVAKKERLAKKDFDKDGKVESEKDEVWGSRFKAAKEADKLKEDTKEAIQERAAHNPIDDAKDTQAVKDFARGAWSGSGGSTIRAVGDYAIKNAAAKITGKEGTTLKREFDQEAEKDAAAEKRSPVAYSTGEVAGTVAAVASAPVAVARLGVKGVQLGAKYLPTLIGRGAAETPKLTKALDVGRSIQTAADRTGIAAGAALAGTHAATAARDTDWKTGQTAGDSKVREISNTVSQAVFDAPVKAIEKAKKKFDESEIVVDEASVFSEKELAYFTSIVEAQPVAPTPGEYVGSKSGPSVRDLSDETDPEKKSRGRPKGSGSAGTPHVIDQIRHAHARGSADDSSKTYSLKHPVTGSTKSVSQDDAHKFYSTYHSSQKPSEKNKHLSNFLGKHFGDNRAADIPTSKMTPDERLSRSYLGTTSKKT